MALSDSSVIIPGQGFIYLAPTGTAKPANAAEPATPWENMGHTSTDDNFTITRDGGDSEVLPTWQNPSFRERREPSVYIVQFTALQIDNTVLGLYFGGGDASVTGEFSVTSATGATERAMYTRIVDGNNSVGLYIPKVSITSEDDAEADIEAFFGFPLKATVLQVTGSNLMTFLGTDLGALLAAPTGVTVGTITATSVALSWTAVATAASYVVQRSTDSGATWTDVAAANGGAPTTTSTTVSGLTASTAYRFRVIAVSTSGRRGTPSTSVSATTTA